MPERATRACPVQPTTPLGPDQVNVLSLLFSTSFDLAFKISRISVNRASRVTRFAGGTRGMLAYVLVPDVLANEERLQHRVVVTHINDLPGRHRIPSQ
jgi:hypothetical protein